MNITCEGMSEKRPTVNRTIWQTVRAPVRLHTLLGISTKIGVEIGYFLFSKGGKETEREPDMSLISQRIKEWRLPFVFVAVTGFLIFAAFAAFFFLTTTNFAFLSSSMDIEVIKRTEQGSPALIPQGTPEKWSAGMPASPGNKRVEETHGTPSGMPVNASLALPEEETEPLSPDEDGGLELNWKVCKEKSGTDYIPCLDNLKAIKRLKSRRRMQHRERHCPHPASKCLVPLPRGYRTPISWPQSKDTIWYNNVPHPKLVEYKKDQNWVKVSGDYLVFPGGGTQFKDGVDYYVQFLEKISPSIEFGKHTRVIMDVGCGVASFGGYLLERDVLTMSFAPKDEHEAQIQMALERGIPAFLSVIATQRLTFPDNAYDMVHCARCRVHWYGDGGTPLLEINRILRPGGFFVWSAAPIYRNDSRHTTMWNAMVNITKSMCWKVVANKKATTGVGVVIYQKPISSSCYKSRASNDPPICDRKHMHNKSWYTPLEICLNPLPSSETEIGYGWPPPWPQRLNSRPTWFSKLSQVHDLPDFTQDTENWAKIVKNLYLEKISLNWSIVRNIMDMNAAYGGFAAALVDKPVWVMNVVPTHVPDTLPIIFSRGLIGVYHDWCESFNTYPRTYDLLHVNNLFRNLSLRCNMVDKVAEMDRVLRPGGWALIKDSVSNVKKLKALMISLHWKITFRSKELFVVRKTEWRPTRSNS